MLTALDLLLQAGLLMAIIGGAYRIARIEQKVSWLCTRYAKDHESAIDWSGSPIADGGDKNDSNDDNDTT